MRFKISTRHSVGKLSLFILINLKQHINNVQMSNSKNLDGKLKREELVVLMVGRAHSPHARDSRSHYRR